MEQIKGFFSKIGSWFVELGPYALNRGLPALVLLVVGILLIRLLIRGVVKLLEKSHMEKAAYTLIKAVLKILLYGLLGLILASHLGIDVTGVIALASVLTLAISLSVQNAITNVISGFTLIYTDPFSSGDYVEIAGQAGSVLEIGLTYTKLATPDNKIIYIPNGSVTSAEIVNYTVTGTRRMDISVCLPYRYDVETVLQALKEAGTVPGILEEKGVFTAVTRYADRGVEYVLRIWTKTEDFWDVQFAVNHRLKETLEKHSIEMTYPQYNVHLDK